MNELQMSLRGHREATTPTYENRVFAAVSNNNNNNNNNVRLF